MSAACECDAPRCERDGCQDTPTRTLYICHECGGVLDLSMSRTMLILPTLPKAPPRSDASRADRGPLVSPSMRHCLYCGSPCYGVRTCGAHRDLPALDRMPRLDAEVRRERAKVKR